MTVHRDRFPVNKTNRRTEFQLYYWYFDSTCFGQPFCPSSGVFLTVQRHWYNLCSSVTEFYQEQEGIPVNIHGCENLYSQSFFLLFLLSVFLVRPAGNISDVSCLLVPSCRTHGYFFQSKVTDVADTTAFITLFFLTVN